MNRDDVPQGAAGVDGSGASGGAAGVAGYEDITPGGADTGPRSPATLPALALWLEGVTGSFTATDGRVSTWKDSSGNGNDANESDAERQPLLRAQDLNGYPTVLFDGRPSNLIVRDSTSLLLGNVFTVAFVGEWTNEAELEYTTTDQVVNVTYPGYGAILTKTYAGEPYAGLALFANYGSLFLVPAQRRLGAQLEIGTAQLVSSATNLNDGVFRLFVVQRPAAGTLEIRINGLPQGHMEIPAEIDATARGRDLNFGGEPTRDFRGALAEVVIVNGPLTEGQRQGLEAHLMEKFGL
jgi:hypothetical protein